MKEKKVNIDINTTEEFLASRQIDLDYVKDQITFLMDKFGFKYLDLFPTSVKSNDIDNILFYNKVLRPLVDCDGFNSHLKEYNKANENAHLFTARVANYLIKKGYKVELEPIMESKTGAHPDIKIEKDNVIAYVECKTSNISNYYGLENKQKFANYIYDNVPTAFQLDFFFKLNVDIDLIRKEVESNSIIKQIYLENKDKWQDNHLKIEINENLYINVVARPAIIGSEESHPIMTVGGLMENNETKTRSVGFMFHKGGRAIGVWDVVDYTNKLKSKKEQSEKQLVEGYPNIVFLRYTDIIGDPELHKMYIENYWLNEELPFCSAVVMFENYKDVTSNSIEDQLTTYINPHAQHPIEL